VTPSNFWSIEKVYSHLRYIYGNANALTTPRHERFAFLNLAAGDLSRCYRKGRTELLPIALAQIIGWFVSVGDELFRGGGGRLIATAMSEKYPLSGCGYCGKSPCICRQEVRNENTLSEASPAQIYWSLRQWQGHIGSLYGKTNLAAGVDRVINRLFEEISEVGLVLYQVDGVNESLWETKQRIAREMADVLAWIFSVSNILSIDLERAVVALYSEGCPICREPECICRAFELRPNGHSLAHRFMSAEDVAATKAA
jgi:NTP pyrophosphatase (non-canonical NTP hydrolase)